MNAYDNEEGCNAKAVHMIFICKMAVGSSIGDPK
jgi:hypothetical protein